MKEKKLLSFDLVIQYYQFREERVRQTYPSKIKGEEKAQETKKTNKQRKKKERKKERKRKRKKKRERKKKTN